MDSQREPWGPLSIRPLGLEIPLCTRHRTEALGTLEFVREVEAAAELAFQLRGRRLIFGFCGRRAKFFSQSRPAGLKDSPADAGEAGLFSTGDGGSRGWNKCLDQGKGEEKYREWTSKDGTPRTPNFKRLRKMIINPRTHAPLKIFEGINSPGQNIGGRGGSWGTGPL